MKNLFLAIIVLIFCACGASKDKKAATANGASLESRLASFMTANDNMNIEEMADYLYPKLFTIAPKADLIKSMQETFNGDEMQVELDEVKVDTLYPVFDFGEGSYAKVKYSMVMRMNFKNNSDSTSDNKEMLENIKQSMAAEYGADNVSLDDKGIISIKEKSIMVAIKDEYAKEWSFVELKEDDPMTEKLFTKELLAKLATYN